jgi:hypothetical protein
MTGDRVRLALPKLRRQKKPPVPVVRRPAVAPDDVETHDHTLRLQFRARASYGVRLPTDPQGPRILPRLLDGLALSEVELIEPMSDAYQQAAPVITNPKEAQLWLNAHGQRSPIARHALYVLELLDAIDLAYETFAVTLLHGNLDSTGVPRFDAIVGGLASYWDETTGELIVRALLAWGGEGVRADTERFAQRVLPRIMANVLASQGAMELGPSERPVAVAGGQRSACPHCGFTSIDSHSVYCPKCGMRTRT